jgi:hypothetical protein
LTAIFWHALSIFFFALIFPSISDDKNKTQRPFPWIWIEQTTKTKVPCVWCEEMQKITNICDSCFFVFFNYVWISFCFFRLDKKKKEILIANELEFNDSMIFWIVFENITDPLFCCCTTDFCDGLPTTTIPYNNNIKILLLTLSFSLTPFSPIFFWTTNKKIVD